MITFLFLANAHTKHTARGTGRTKRAAQTLIIQFVKARLSFARTTSSMVSIGWVALFCDFTIVLIATLLAIPHDENIDMMVRTNDVVFSTGICESRGEWNASEWYSEGQCVLYSKNNCIYIRQDGFSHGRTYMTMATAPDSGRWASGGPSFKHFNCSACVSRNMPPVRAHEIPHYVYLQMLEDSIAEYCKNPNRTYVLRDWFASFFDRRSDTQRNEVCFIETMGNVILPSDAGTMFWYNLSHYMNNDTVHYSLMMHWMAGGVQCRDDIDRGVARNIGILAHTRTILTLCVIAGLLLYSKVWRWLRRQYDCKMSYWTYYVHCALFVWLNSTCSDYLTGARLVKVVRFYELICPENSPIYSHATLAIMYYFACAKYLYDLCGELYESKFPPVAASGTRPPPIAVVPMSGGGAKKKKKRNETKKTK